MRIDIRPGKEVNDDLVHMCGLDVHVLFNGIRIDQTESVAAIDTIENWYVRYGDKLQEELIKVPSWIKLEVKPGGDVPADVVRYFNERAKAYTKSKQNRRK